jgi:2-amino-4-hydroxy-6-hydroxymethyldihydropteridine diphosphokinase
VSERIFVGLGANLGDAIAAVGDAITAIEAIPDVELVQRSRLYRSSPWGDPNQPEFINAVIELSTSLPPQALLAHLASIEVAAGRRRSNRRWGPRVLDLDLLAHGDRQLHDPNLILPHPRLHQRLFVLKPWSEIAPEFEVAGKGLVGELLTHCADPGAVHSIHEAEEC